MRYCCCYVFKPNQATNYMLITGFLHWIFSITYKVQLEPFCASVLVAFNHVGVEQSTTGINKEFP